ncbi:hypothetical protein ENUP19_0002G0075 [Entamoeba nuttalli]|uniref:Uncharacterized protein n=2 Tax=Entamoeba nuttalli TaxID=412467 RepID=K2I1T6_ENTNP|nr:hypothetical protein ENU1_011430 [Entamoeba nuttalli P19]EKE42750.1 hypothetical protein ENU1_011430 [Entamoeba nuttalli P19]|eukprot:XP_008854914.1 hypothetical protein ENU1_011430 [Entamoeba nuttalli P19]
MSRVRQTLYPHLTWEIPSLTVSSDEIKQCVLQVNGSAPATLLCSKNGYQSEFSMIIDSMIELNEILQQWTQKKKQQFESEIGEMQNEHLIECGTYEITIKQSLSICHVTVVPGEFNSIKSKLIEPIESKKNVVGDKMFIKYRPVDFNENMLNFESLQCSITHNHSKKTFNIKLYNLGDCYGSPIPIFTQQGGYTLSISSSVQLLYSSTFFLKAGKLDITKCLLFQDKTIITNSKEIIHIQKKIDSTLTLVVGRPLELNILLSDSFGNVIKEFDSAIPISVRHSQQLTVTMNESILKLNALSSGTFSLNVLLLQKQNGELEKIPLSGFPVTVIALEPLELDLSQISLCKKVPESMTIGDLLTVSFVTYNSELDEVGINQIQLVDVQASINSIPIQSCVISRECGFDVNIWVCLPGILTVSISIDGHMIKGFPTTINIEHPSFVKFS